MAKTATAEEPELTPLQLVEQEHGFRFGSDFEHEDAKAPRVASVVCTNPTCSRNRDHISIHADAVIPVHCGECFSVLYCPHNFDDKDTNPVQKVRAGTFAAPQEHTFQRCEKCGTESKHEVEFLPAMSLNDLPIGLVDKLIAGADDPAGNVRL